MEKYSKYIAEVGTKVTVQIQLNSSCMVLNSKSSPTGKTFKYSGLVFYPEFKSDCKRVELVKFTTFNPISCTVSFDAHGFTSFSIDDDFVISGTVAKHTIDSGWKVTVLEDVTGEPLDSFWDRIHPPIDFIEEVE